MSGALNSFYGTLGKGSIIVTELSKTTSTTSNTTLASNSISTIAGRVYVVMMAWDPSGASVPTVTLSDGANTYTALSTLLPAPSVTGAGNGLLIQSFITTAATTASRTITATFSAAITAKAMTVIELFGATTTQRNAATSSTGTTVAPSIGSPSANAKDLVLVTLGQETNIAGQPTSGATGSSKGFWTTVSNNYTTGGNASSNVGISYQYKIVTASGTTTGTWTMGSTNQWGMQVFALQAA